MPFFWINSVFMVFYILLTLEVFYFYKNSELMNEIGSNIFHMYYNLKW